MLQIIWFNFVEYMAEEVVRGQLFTRRPVRLDYVTAGDLKTTGINFATVSSGHIGTLNIGTSDLLNTSTGLPKFTAKITAHRFFFCRNSTNKKNSLPLETMDLLTKNIEESIIATIFPVASLESGFN